MNSEEGYVLVVGSVHLDILAFISPHTANNIDKIGSIKICTGGTAFNVADSLSRHRVPNKLYSILKEESFATNVILRDLERRRMDTSFIQKKQIDDESGFIAHMLGAEMINSVSCTTIQDQEIRQNEIYDAMLKASMVAIECNLSVEQIKKIAENAYKLRKPLGVCGVSQSKVNRIWRIFTGKEKVFKFVILNENEIKQVIDKNETGEEICKAFSAENVFITMGNMGIKMISKDGQDIDIVIKCNKIASTLGAGDAIFAALCSHFSKNSKITYNELEHVAQQYVAPIMAVNAATLW